MKKLLLLFSLLCTHLFSTEIVFWHGFEGFLYEKFAEIVKDFNEQSEEYHVTLLFQGNLTDVFTKGIQAHNEGHPPHILQVYEVATQTMMLQPELFVPVDDLLRKYHRKFDPDIYIDAVREFYSSHEGKMFSLPWNASTGILFYNKEAFAKAGLTHPPKTWEEMEEMGKKLVDAGYIAFTTAWPVAYHLEHICSWHNLPYATHENGIGGLQARLAFNTPYLVRHIQKLSEWHKSGIFSYQGAFTKEPEELFTQGKCAILLQGSNRYPMLKKMSPHSIGVSFMPYWSDIPGAPYRLNIGGSSFWALSGFNEKTYRGIAQFFSYLSLPEVQAYWHQQTGYLPITESAYYLTKKKSFYPTNPAAEIAILEVMNSHNTPHTKGIRLGNYTTIRNTILSHLEQAFQGKLSAQEALDQAVQEGNKLLEDFERKQ